MGYTGCLYSELYHMGHKGSDGIVATLKPRVQKVPFGLFNLFRLTQPDNHETVMRIQNLERDPSASAANTFKIPKNRIALNGDIGLNDMGPYYDV